MNVLVNLDTKGKLVLADGDEIQGYSFGANKSMAGEVVFNTGMVGYPESLTDPSYCGQILVLTFPMIGNYGVPSDSKDENGLLKYFESRKIQVAGLIVAEYSQTYSHWNAAKSLGQWLSEAGIPALYGIDTRRLTKKIRIHGSILGKIEFAGQAIPFEDPNTRNLVAEVSTKVCYSLGDENSSVHILAFDCGIKYNILRYFVDTHCVRLTVVPYNYPLESNPESISYDGIFLSNGPGDPAICKETIASLKWAMERENPKPIFGICLGNQLMALACGGKTYKMTYGNRGMNQPCIDLQTSKCYITPQNHGFAVDNASLPPHWQPLFINANDLSNEGIIHTSKPFFSVQFHPEAQGGPTESSFLFDTFLDIVRGTAQIRSLLSPLIYERSVVRKVLLVGSGGLSIGQAGEFDYSGSQACKALKEEGIEVIVINPNIATVQTSKNLGRASPDKVYFLPIRAHVIEEIIAKERPDGIIVSMGGQTALNVGIELWRSGVFEKYSCKVLGTPIDTIIATEDRELFSQKLAEINESLALSYSASNVDEALQVASKIGYPVLVRAAFALGGLGSGFADNADELRIQCEKAFAISSQILIDQDLRGWKEVEYEVVRDCRDNCITVCNMENFDPLGVHTGDSIVVAPSQTLTNSEYFKLRSTALKVIRALKIVGECNIQYALNPVSEEYCIIEVNARLSRSSALASKATGYPLAYVATKLSIGQDLVSIRNSVNKTTTACFEPSLDYCVVKVPRWDLAKFNRVSTKLGSSMTSVGEVMAIGRNFEEAIQKAVRMVSGGRLDGLDGEKMRSGTSVKVESSDLDVMLRVPTDTRLAAVQTALEQGYSVDEIHSLSRIDKWFLSKLKKIASLKEEISRYSFDQLSPEHIKTMKCAGFSDSQIARYTKSSEFVIRRRRQQWGITPFCKQIDTLAAEFPAETNYLYMTYNGTEHDVVVETGPSGGGVMVLGCGAYCIGSSVEFDWCAVSAVRQLRSMGDKAIVVNYNPETVSTDFDESDKLYFEELTQERVLDIYELEKSVGVIVSVGGQIPNNLAMTLHQQGVHILGTSPENINKAEDRHLFSAMLDKIKVDQPEWSELTTKEDAFSFAAQVGYPVLVRPSFVLSGAAMAVACTESELTNCLSAAEEISQDKPVVISKFMTSCKEIEFDAVAQKGAILNYAISEHVENAGVHSGDATLVLPAQKLYVQTVRKVKSIASQIARALNISGPFNIQLLAKDNYVKVIECNLRASRTFPFISKTLDANFITLATKVMMGYECRPYNISLIDYDYVAVKAPMFSFTRLRGADPTLGVEMSSTGEVACFGHDVQEAFLQSLLATTFKLPQVHPNKHILISIAEDRMRESFVPAMEMFRDMGYNLSGTPGTAEFYMTRGFKITSLDKPPFETPKSVSTWIRNGYVDLVINIPEGTTRREEVTSGYLMRRLAVDFGCSLITNLRCAELFADALHRAKPLPCISVEEFIGTAPHASSGFV
eukprot:CAMPEP_0185029084 /NCGR_PEP_ID=MMETSP1103-20130426/15178_1 /TAXON_ID=36769 /ORGANISM="Paraphysomonas bandaiensis, Strain Caron Lab Isolate" /LENGTH=1476 /DNA_ID=CAMNT_0027563701 /DNA_START=111 /DNA_END=4541 /DNA_ORIENTATION=-